ncbi:hypothetical protein ACLOJK_011893 [Asimina triloba]
MENIAVMGMAPHAGMIMVQLISALYVVVSKMILIEGISSTVFVTYQLAMATLVAVAVALIFRRVTLSQNLLSACLYYISSTLEAAVINMLPVFTYMLSIISRQERLEINVSWGKGKLFGTLVTVAGAFILMLSKEPAPPPGGSSHSTAGWGSERLLGLAMVVVGVLALSAWILLLVGTRALKPITNKYPAESSMTAIMLFFAALQSIVVAAISSHRASEWQLKWDLELVNAVYGAVFYYGVSNMITVWCASKRGPVFVASFTPLSLVFTSILEIALLGDAMSVGSIAGSIIIIGGLYIYLWSKKKEEMHRLMERDHDTCASLIENITP